MNIIKMIDIFPGYKTYMTMGLALGMAICQMGGWHMFSESEWTAVGVTGGMFWKMGQDRRKRL